MLLQHCHEDLLWLLWRARIPQLVRVLHRRVHRLHLIARDVTKQRHHRAAYHLILSHQSQRRLEIVCEEAVEGGRVDLRFE